MDITRHVRRALRSLGYELRRVTPFSETPIPHDIRDCYRLFWGRDPGPGELEKMGERVLGHHSLQDLVSLFIEDPEFRDRRAEYLANRSELELVELPDFRIWVSKGDFLIGKAIRDEKRYEPHVEAAIRRILKPGSTFVDVGANVGYHTLVAASTVGPEGQVCAFEPSPFNCGLLKRSLEANGFTNVTLFPFAVADSERELVFDDIGGSNGKVGEIKAATRFVDGRLAVRSVTLDDTLAGVQVDLIKADVEGAEGLVFKGAEGVLARCRPRLVVELSEQLRGVSGVAPGEFLSLLSGYGYSFSALRRDGTVDSFGGDVEAVCGALAGCAEGHLDLLGTPV